MDHCDGSQAQALFVLYGVILGWSKMCAVWWNSKVSTVCFIRSNSWMKHNVCSVMELRR